MMGSFTVPSVFGPEFNFTAYCIAVTQCFLKFFSSGPVYVVNHFEKYCSFKGFTYLWFVLLGRIMHPKLKTAKLPF